MSKYAYLIMVTTANNNKYYEMTENDDGTFTSKYGRIGSSAQIRSYPMSKWNSTLNSKVKKGYVDQTRLVAEEVKVSSSTKEKYKPIPDNVIKNIVDRLQAYARKTVERNYMVSSTKVTQVMIDEAQRVLDKLLIEKNLDLFNKILLELFNIIPRKMSRVNDYLSRDTDGFTKLIQDEQDLLDVMAGQVKTNAVEDSDEESVDKTILEIMRLEIQHTDENDVVRIKQELGGIKDKYYDSWKVVNLKTQKVFDKFIVDENITNTKLLWHGSRNENWWGILNTGLVLRPSATITGKMFGYGIYFAPKARKSLGYTSINGSYWASGNSSSAFMSLYEVAYGTPYDVHSFDSRYYDFNYSKLQNHSKGANCLHAHAGKMLRNDEIIVYKEEQLTIKYLVELK